MSGKFNWNELMTDDINRAKAFYGQTLGWTFEPFPMPDGEYWIAKAPDGTPTAGIMPMDPEDKESQPGWLSYVQVEDLDARLNGPTIDAETLLDLTAGQVIRLDHSVERPLRLEVNGTEKYVGQPVDLGHRRGFLIESLLDSEA